MRIFLIVVACLALLISLGLGLLTASSNLSSKNAARMAKAQKMLKQLKGMGGGKLGALGKKADAMMAKASGYKTAGYGGILVPLLALAALITMFMKKAMPVLITAGGCLVLFLLFTILAPSFDTGSFGPASPRSQVLVFGIAAAISAAASFGADRIRVGRAS